MANLETHPAPPATRGTALRGILPGTALAALIALVALGLRQLSGIEALSPLVLAIVIGMALRTAGLRPDSAIPGMGFCMKVLLRFGIVLLGLQLTAQQVQLVGGSGVLMIAATVVATFAFTTWLGRVLGLDAGLTQLVAAGSAICGASAVIATNTVTRARDEDVAYAIACVTVFGSLSMLLIPLAGGLLSLPPRAFGLWSGASIHEVAQVIAAGYARGQEAGEFATIAKLTRVMMLAPAVLTLAFLARRRASHEQGARVSVPVPWFVLGFVAMVGLASTGWVPSARRPRPPW